MGIIAVAGGNGPVGKAIVDGLTKHGHKVYVLSRTVREPQWGISYLAVNYDDVDATSESLHNVKADTLVSAIGLVTEDSNEAQKNMIRAASKSSTTRRFVLSGFDMLHLEEHISLNPIAKHTFQAIDLLKTTNLEYTRLANGWFSDYYGMPHYKTHLHPWINVLNMERKWAVVPGDGTARVNYITTQDMARCFAKLIDLERWEDVTSIVSDELSLNEVVGLAEEVRGCKFDVVYDDLSKLKDGRISHIDEFPSIGLGDEDEKLFAMVHWLAGSGYFKVPTEGVMLLNEVLPNERFTTVREVMERSWKSKQYI